jgi:uncharacterized DUF497 family protein
MEFVGRGGTSRLGHGLGLTERIAAKTIENDLYYVVYVDRENIRSIISLRRATGQEVKRYAEECY